MKEGSKVTKKNKRGKKERKKEGRSKKGMKRKEDQNRIIKEIGKERQ